jgi:hypothetical protein
MTQIRQAKKRVKVKRSQALPVEAEERKRIYGSESSKRAAKANTDGDKVLHALTTRTSYIETLERQCNGQELNMASRPSFTGLGLG